MGSPLIDVRDQAGGRPTKDISLPPSLLGRVGRASGGDADLGWAVFSGAVSRAGLRGSREERGKEGGRKLSGYDSRRPRRRGELGGTQPPAFEAEIQGPKIARASTPDITLPQHGIWGVSGMGERRAWLVRPHKYADGGRNITECFALPRKQAAIFNPPVLSPSRQQVILLSSFLSPLPRKQAAIFDPPVLSRVNKLFFSLRSYHPSPARPANSSYGSDRSQSSNVQPTNFLSVCPPVCAPVG